MNLVTLKGAVASATFAVALLGASAASAATLKSPKPDDSPTAYTTKGNCSTGDVTSLAADACFGQLVKDGPGGINDNVKVDFNADTFGGVTGLFGYTDWNLDPLTVTVLGEGKKSGSWTTSFDFSTVARAFLVIKGGSSFSTYLFDTASDAASGTFTTAGLMNGGKNQPALSHFDIFVGGTPDGDVDGPMSPVPLPAGLPMLLSAVAGMAYLRKRKQKV